MMSREARRCVHLVFFLFVVILCCGWLAACGDDNISGSDNELEWNKKIAVAIVHTHAAMLAEVGKNYSTETERIDFIRTAIDSVRFYDDQSGYFYVYNYDCVNIAHATQKDLQGQNLYDYTDSRGKYVIRELSAASQAGGGFVEYYWIKPGSSGEKKKLGYVEPIPGTDYFIGTGVYMD